MAIQPKTSTDHRLIAPDTYEYLAVSGNVAYAGAQGLTATGYPSETAYEWVAADPCQLLNHGLEPAASAPRCDGGHDGHFFLEFRNFSTTIIR